MRKHRLLSVGVSNISEYTITSSLNWATRQIQLHAILKSRCTIRKSILKDILLRSSNRVRYLNSNRLKKFSEFFCMSTKKNSSRSFLDDLEIKKPNY